MALYMYTRLIDMAEKVKKTEDNTKEQPKRTRCIAVYGKDGMLYNLSVSLEGPIRIYSIKNELFHGSEMERMDLRDGDDEESEGVIMFWTGDKGGMPWDLNPFLTEFLGHPVYSPVVVFVAEQELLGDSCTWEWDEFSMSIRNLIHDTLNRKAVIPKSKVFGISSITMRLGTDKVTVKEGHEKKNLDDYWMKFYRGRYVTEFITTDCRESGDDAGYPVTLLEKPCLVTALHIYTGDADIWFASNQETLKAMWKEIKAVDIDEEDPDKYKELYNKEVNKIKIKYAN